MNVNTKSILFMLLMTTAALPFSSLAHAEYGLSGSVKAQALALKDDNLGTTNANNSDSQSLEGKARLTFKPSEDLKFLAEGRAVANAGTRGNVDEFGNETTDEDFLELRQFWVEFDNVMGASPVSFKAGRQRFSEDRSLWWNRDFDALRLSYDITLLKGFVALGENQSSYRTDSGSFAQDDENLFRAFSEVSYQWQPSHFIEGRAHIQDDHSGIEQAGAVVQADDLDREDEDLLWLGVRFAGDIAPVFKNVSPVKYHAEFMTVSGSEDTLTTGAGPTATTRTVTGSVGRDVFGWGFDGGFDVPVDVGFFQPVLLLNYAYGSGDDGTGTDGAFRQSDISGNYARQGVSSSSTHNFGSVLRPELSNMHVFTAGTSFSVLKASDITTSYNYYRRVDENSGIGSSGISAPLNATDNDLGYGLDIMTNIKLADELGLQDPFLKGVDLKGMFGSFRAGDAYGANEGDTAIRTLFEISAKF